MEDLMDRTTKVKWRRRWALICGVAVWTAAPVLLAAGYLQARQQRLEREQEIAERDVIDAAINSLREGASHGHIVIDAEGLVLSFNPALEKWTGYSAKEMHGGTLERVMAPDAWARHDAAYREFLVNDANLNKTVRLQCELIPKDPGKKPVVVWITARVVQPPGKPRVAIALVDRASRVLEISNTSEGE
jgi:PAS domain S-box-containing protein